MKILFITRKSERCGVADYGKRLFDIIQPHLDITKCETEGTIDYTGYDLALINYHYATLPFLTGKLPIRSIALFHEAFQNFEADRWVNVSELPRPLLKMKPIDLREGLPCYFGLYRIGSFGFGFPDKNFPGIAKMVRREFDQAVIRLNIPFAEFGDHDGALARSEVAKCVEILKGSNIELQVSHDFKPANEMVEWLAENDINIFNHTPSCGRGISSSIDYALSANRPIGISSSEMYKHMPREICIDNISLPRLIQQGTRPLKEVLEANSNERLIAKMKEILSS